jgi:hypothetical protein
VIVYDQATGDCRWVARAPEHGAIITAVFDARRNVMAGLSNPSGRLLVCNIANGSLQDLGPVTNGGSPCRSIEFDSSGRAWFTREPGKLISITPGDTKLEVADARMPHPELPGESGMGVWRTALWDDAAGHLYAVHARTAFLFTFNSRTLATASIGSLAVKPDRADPRSTFASLAFARAPDGRLFTVAARGIFDFPNSRPLRRAPHLVSFEPGGETHHRPRSYCRRWPAAALGKPECGRVATRKESLKESLFARRARGRRHRRGDEACSRGAGAGSNKPGYQLRIAANDLDRL